MKNNVYLYVCHFVNDHIIESYNRIRTAVGKEGKVFFLLHKEEEEEISVPDEWDYYIFSYETINKLNYHSISESLIPGSNHFAVLQFYKEYPEYDYYWVIEYDVDFTGNWTVFLNAFHDIPADLLSSHIQRYEQSPGWPWWNTLYLKDYSLSTDQLVRSFNPVYRLSVCALTLLDEVLQQHNCGHHEVFIPTLLAYHGYTLVDFGGKGEFVLPGYEERFYLAEDKQREVLPEGTMCFRPVFKEIRTYNLQDKLFHPYKGLAGVSKDTKVLTLIVTYNGENWIEGCLDSVFASTFSPDVMVVDNCSTDRTVEMIREKYPDVLLIANKENKGFGQGNNAGFAYALEKKYEYVLLLNQDAQVAPGMLEGLLVIAQNYYEYGILSPVHWDGTGEEIDRNFYRYMTGQSPEYVYDLVKGREIQDVYRADFLNAAIWLVSVECIYKTGGFDPIFFHTGEDGDFVNRAFYKGFKLGVCPHQKAYHHRENRPVTDPLADHFFHKYVLSVVDLKNPRGEVKLCWLLLNLVLECIPYLCRGSFRYVAGYWKVIFRLIANHKQIKKHRAICLQSTEPPFLELYI
ncbi:MAG: glycosyltransferase [Tannerellaceae bacterium]|nr:glycosyltransferase [Tannerellaceae bacterium]